jgi:NTP pyrophosphatase (non-canonical NTP hydrolase)
MDKPKDQTTMEPSYEDLFQRFKTFSETTFKDAALKSYLTKLQEESKELMEEPSMEELADCMLVLIGASRFLEGDLKKEIEKKIKVNESRSWRRMPDGTYHHTSPKSSQPQ